jgi:3alpha(or 20beta)-hydroxysteroid dehydrogenase
MDANGFRRVIDINLVGAYIGTRAVLPSMKRAGGGSIINISSVAGLSPAATYGAYTASKYALVGVTKVSALELAPLKIRVNSVHPGLIDTPMNPDGSVYPLGRQPIPRLGQPSEVARMVLFLASEEASFCTGATYVVDGGYLSLVGIA